MNGLIVSTRIACLAIIVSALAMACAHAQSWPARPVRLLVPFPPGGAADIVARIAADKLTATWGQPVVPEYRPGAGGTIATSELVNSSGGHTLMIGTLGTHAIAPGLYSKLPYDPGRDLIPVAMLMLTPMVLVASPTLGVNSVQEFVALARADPGKYPIASPGNGTLNHLMAEMFKQATRLDMVHIPYKSGTHPDLISGRTALLFDPLVQVLQHVKQGNLKPLAISHRSPLLPGVPTMAEAGLKHFDIGLWFGLFAPAGTPPAVVAKVSDDAVKAMNSPDVVQKVEALSSQVMTVPHAQFAQSLQSDLSRWRKVVAELQIRAD
ncbi:MAG: tripartite tricarboxylate transporter substrate binding protein [Proteobacteria bacterium]|nr:tripartite tricarboxylate transporter substrate binding protein [Burkholderiales bacterium]